MSPRPDHDRLWSACKKRPEDYQPYGRKNREVGEEWLADCSAGCRHYVPLEGDLGYDWGACTNPKSHRVGLLTFEHQGCEHFEQDAAAGAGG